MMIYAIVWITVTVVLWGVIAFMDGRCPTTNPEEIIAAYSAALVWPICVGLALIIAPFVFLHWLGKYTAPSHPEGDGT